MLLKKNKIDIFHSPSFFGPILAGCKVIMTIHDMIHVLFPEESSVLHRAYYSIIVRKAAKNASRILTDSENSKRDISKYLNVPSDKIVVTYLAVDSSFRRSQEGEINEIKDQFGINDKYILYVGSQKPHKNVGLLIEAYHRLREKISHQLVIVGKKDRLFQKGMRNHKLEGVIFVGEVQDELLPHFYSGADVFVSPSLYEGFGLPLIEALACETPVVTIKTSSVDEVLGDAGLIVELNSSDKLAMAIYKVLSDEDLRNSLVKKGMAMVKRFSWEETVNRTLKVYEEV
jgi:glycosyltransferase involved in cell wall biosynthesis